MTELKHCPFCGEFPRIYVEDGYYYVGCDCGAVMLDGLSCNFDSKEEAIKAWNKRKREKIVLCKDCVHALTFHDDVVCMKPHGTRATHPHDWFCADGKREG